MGHHVMSIILLKCLFQRFIPNAAILIQALIFCCQDHSTCPPCSLSPFYSSFLHCVFLFSFQNTYLIKSHFYFKKILCWLPIDYRIKSKLFLNMAFRNLPILCPVCLSSFTIDSLDNLQLPQFVLGYQALVFLFVLLLLPGCPYFSTL